MSQKMGRATEASVLVVCSMFSAGCSGTMIELKEEVPVRIDFRSVGPSTLTLAPVNTCLRTKKKISFGSLSRLDEMAEVGVRSPGLMSILE